MNVERRFCVNEKSKFFGVSDTMFIPLAARIAISKRFPEYFYDEQSMQLENLDQIKLINKKVRNIYR